MSVRRGVAALVTLAVLSGCGGGEAPTTAAPQASANVYESAREQSPGAQSPGAQSPREQSPSKPASPTASRQDQVAAFVKRQPGTFGIMVRDRQSGAVWKAGNTTATTWTASTIKLAIAADLLERQRAGQLTLDATDRTNLNKALINSDNDAATALWERYDGPGMLARFRSRFGMAGLAVVSGYDTFWRNLRCSAEDLNALMSYVLERLAAEDRAYLVDTLRKVASNQHWGVWAAGSAQRPGNKDGWAQKPVNGRTVWVTHTVGFAGTGERYVVSAMYEQGPSGTLASGAHAVSDAVALYFGAKVPAAVTLP